tara:strand:+ start:44235 stop:45113 length:879 start_codon:yes stop_codon:yes gene_type:complete
MTDAEKDIVERLESKFIQEVAATLEEVSSCLDRYADVDDGDEGQPEANAALRQKCAVDEILGRFPKDRDETFRIGDAALHEFIPDTCSHGVIEWNLFIGQGYAAWVGESGVQHRHSHPTNPLIALTGAIIKHHATAMTTLRAEVERLTEERKARHPRQFKYAPTPWSYEGNSDDGYYLLDANGQKIVMLLWPIHPVEETEAVEAEAPLLADFLAFQSAWLTATTLDFFDMERRADKAEAERDAAIARVEKLEAVLSLILPLAKGYAAQNRVGSNAEYIASAEETLASLTEGE